MNAQLIPLHRQIARTSRRLFAQTLIHCLVWCWSGALVLALAWFLAQPALFSLFTAEPTEMLRWVVAGGILGAGTILAVGLACQRAPSKLHAALALDEKFGLRERVTTSLTLTSEQQATPAGQALLADIDQRISQLQVGSRFPVRVPRTAGLVPVLVAVLAVLGLYYPFRWDKVFGDVIEANAQPLGNAAEVEQSMKKLEKKPREERPADTPDAQELQRIEEELDKLAHKPPATQDDARDRLVELSKLEDQIESQEQRLAAKAKALEEQLQQMDRLAKKQKPKDGPAKDLQDALAKGDVGKAKEEADRLSKALKDNKLTKEEKQQLEEQLDDLQDKLDRLSRQKDEEERLRDLADKGEIDKETLDRELDQLKKDKEDLKDLEDLADDLKQCEKCMKDGDDEGAEQALERVSRKLKQMQCRNQERDDLADQLSRVQEAKKSLAKGMGGKPAQGAGRRPEADGGDTNSKHTKVTGDFDARRQKELVGTGAPGRSFKPKTSAEIATEIKQASQQAPDAIERQRIPKAASDIAKGYFENLGGQKDAKKGNNP